MISRLKYWYRVFRSQVPRSSNTVSIDFTSTYAHAKNICLEDYVRVGPRCFIDGKGKVYLREGTVLAADVVILSSSHDYKSLVSLPYGGEDICKPVEIGRGVWIGHGAMILPGVSIGDASVVGAGSVVTKSFPPGAVIAGNPAKVIASRLGNDWQLLLDEKRYRLRLKQEVSL